MDGQCVHLLFVCQFVDWKARYYAMLHSYHDWNLNYFVGEVIFNVICERYSLQNGAN